jgi:hypothetical protein
MPFWLPPYLKILVWENSPMQWNTTRKVSKQRFAVWRFTGPRYSPQAIIVKVRNRLHMAYKNPERSYAAMEWKKLDAWLAMAPGIVGDSFFLSTKVLYGGQGHAKSLSPLQQGRKQSCRHSAEQMQPLPACILLLRGVHPRGE